MRQVTKTVTDFQFENRDVVVDSDWASVGIRMFNGFTPVWFCTPRVGYHQSTPTLTTYTDEEMRAMVKSGRFIPVGTYGQLRLSEMAKENLKAVRGDE